MYVSHRWDVWPCDSELPSIRSHTVITYILYCATGHDAFSHPSYESSNHDRYAHADQAAATNEPR